MLPNQGHHHGVEETIGWTEHAPTKMGPTEQGWCKAGLRYEYPIRRASMETHYEKFDCGLFEHITGHRLFGYLHDFITPQVSLCYPWDRLALLFISLSERAAMVASRRISRLARTSLRGHI